MKLKIFNLFFDFFFFKNIAAREIISLKFLGFDNVFRFVIVVSSRNALEIFRGKNFGGTRVNNILSPESFNG